MEGPFGACPADAGILVGMRLIAVREEHDDPHLQRSYEHTGEWAGIGQLTGLPLK